MHLFGLFHLPQRLQRLSPEGRLHISKDVLFNEFWFPYAEVPAASMSSQSTSSLTRAPLVVLPQSTTLTPPISSSPPLSQVSQSTQSPIIELPHSLSNTSSSSASESPIPPSESSTPVVPDLLINTHPMQTRSKSRICKSKTGNPSVPHVLLTCVEPNIAK